MIRVARGTTEIEGFDLDEGYPVRCHVHRRPTGRHAYLPPTDAHARPEHPLHGLPRRRDGAAAVSARAELLRWLDPLSLERGAIRRDPRRVAAAVRAVDPLDVAVRGQLVRRSRYRILQRRPSPGTPRTAYEAVRALPSGAVPLRRQCNARGPFPNSSPPARPLSMSR